jgi:hypothetical protein
MTNYLTALKSASNLAYFADLEDKIDQKKKLFIGVFLINFASYPGLGTTLYIKAVQIGVSKNDSSHTE